MTYKIVYKSCVDNEHYGLYNVNEYALAAKIASLINRGHTIVSVNQGV